MAAEHVFLSSSLPSHPLSSSGLHRHEVLLKPQYQRLKIGTIDGEESQIKVSRRDEIPSRQFGKVLVLPPLSPFTELFLLPLPITLQAVPLGAPSQVPYAEPSYLNPNYFSPYYKETHRKFQREFRSYVDTNVVEIAQRCEESGKRPDPALIKEMGANGVNAMRLGPGKHLAGRKLFGGVKPEEMDYFHEMILTQELVRCGVRGFGDGLQGGMVIGE